MKFDIVASTFEAYKKWGLAAEEIRSDNIEPPQLILDKNPHQRIGIDTDFVIKTLRIEKGISQKYMAKHLGMSRPTYISIEKGRRKFRVSEYKKALEILNSVNS